MISIGVDLLGMREGGGVRPLALTRWGAGGGAIFMIKQKNMRHNEIHVIMMILYVIQYLSIMFDIFIPANCFSPLDV